MTLGSLFLVFEGIGRGLEFLCFWGPPLGDPRLRKHGQVRVNVLSRGSSKQSTDSRLPTARQLKAR